MSDEVAFDPDAYIKGFSREQIVKHLDETLSIVEEVAATHPLGEQLVGRVFDIAQLMHASMQPRKSPVEVPRAPLMTVPRGKH